MIDESCDCGWVREATLLRCICGRPLTREQLDSLPDGTVVSIKWEGGNGPHQYRFRRQHGVPCAMLLDDERCLVSVINFVGPRPPHTVVRWDR